ncbi:MAG: hypothetical protein CYPHOPRED_004082 [Cyphobasidiales sp. Tagirdzhanova-0007]|nr:MAG: hypothetical protein CYPHOPRED_004082 [Cyphobasidiales sp. Tagirdzhanova-0007]
MHSSPRVTSLVLAAAALYCAGAASASQSPISGLSGVNLAGLDFGSDIWATAPAFPHDYLAPPMDQIQHFSSQGVNVFRIPFLWEYMEPNGPGTGLDSSFFGMYDSYVQQALSQGAYVIVDPHNYARWNDEPHDLDQLAWQTTLQGVVNTIRGQGATSQTILLPGTDFTSAGALQYTNWAFLSEITDPAGGTDLLHFDLHIYFDATSDGVSPECVTNHISDILQPLATFLEGEGRKGFVSELGGGSTSSCETYLGQALGFIKSNPNAYAGFTAWAGGAMPSSYALTLSPNGNQDVPIWNIAIQPNLYSSSAVKAKRFERHSRKALASH